MKRNYTYILLVILVTAVLFFAEKYVDRENEHYPVTSSEARKSVVFSNEFLPSSTTGVIIKHNYFQLSYSEAHEQAEWVAYEITKDHLSKNEFERPYFIQDRAVKSGSADWRNYKKSGYDRGHLCPAGARRFSYNAYHETFLTSNISPQDHGFNAGIWNRLEQKVRYWASTYQSVFVITGGVLDNNLPTIGSEEVSVPKEFYKIVCTLSEGKPKAIAFLIPNKNTSDSFYDYIVPIDLIESKTGIDFFEGIPTAIETALEKTVQIEPWGKR